MGKRKLVLFKNGNKKCPTCGTMFFSNMESQHPFDVAVREEFRKRRAKAAKEGWSKRRANGLSHGQNTKRRSRAKQ